MNILNRVVAAACFSIVWVSPVFAECPAADLTGDCYVDLADLAVLANQWLTGSKIPDEMILIPGGTFLMGDSLDETSSSMPVHAVTLSPFYMGKYEVTCGQYCQFLNSALTSGTIYVSEHGEVYGSCNHTVYCDLYGAYGEYSDIPIDYADGVFSIRTKGGRSMVNDPMVEVCWYGAVAYCNWRSQQEGREPCYNLTTWKCDFSKNGYHLPTEAQWEYAARGGLEGKRFPWGDTIDHSQANYFSFLKNTGEFYDVNPYDGCHPSWDDGIEPYTSPVGTFAPNGYGLYDMAGNVIEFCHDWYGSYCANPQTNPTGPKSGEYCILRGGSWGWTSYSSRVALRYHTLLDHWSHSFGLRLVIDSAPLE